MRNVVHTQHTFLDEMEEQRESSRENVRRTCERENTISVFVCTYATRSKYYATDAASVSVVFILVGFRSAKRVNEGYLILN